MNDEIKTILQALIDGEDIEDFTGNDWRESGLGATLTVLADWEYENYRTSLRIKPKTIQIGEFTVPEPLRVPMEVCWYVDPTSAPIYLFVGVAKYTM